MRTSPNPGGCRPVRPRRLQLVLAGLLALALLPGDAASAQAAAAPRAESRAPTVVSGVVVDGASGAPVPAATVVGGRETVVTDAAGRFSVTLSTDDAQLRIAADGYLETTVALDSAVAETGAALEILLFRNTFAETVQVVSAPAGTPARPSATPIAAEAVLEVAGSLDNIFRTLDTLPGVASTGDFGSRLAVRGGTPDQNLTVMDGVEIHNPYRLFGLVGAFNPETVERFELTAGGFGARYGDRLSSLLIVDNRPGERDFGGSSSASVTDANVVLEGAAPGGGSWLLSGRRTYYDLVAGLVTDQSLPAFADVQVQAGWELGPGHRLSVFGLTSRENADFRFDDEDDESSRDTGRLLSEAGNDLGSLRLDALLGGAATSRTIVSWYRNTDLLGVDATFESGARRSNAADERVAADLTNVVFDRDLSVRDLSVRQELTVPLSAAHTLDTGVELHRLASAAGLSITGDRNETVANPSSVRGGTGLPDSLDSSLGGTRGGAWIQDRFTVNPRLSIEPGLRLDWSTVNGDAALSPRFAATLALGWESRLRVAGGLYTQSPGYEKLIQSDYFFDLSPAVVATLRHERATHLVTGFEKDPRRRNAATGGGLLQDLRGPHRRRSRSGGRPACPDRPLRFSPRSCGPASRRRRGSPAPRSTGAAARRTASTPTSSGAIRRPGWQAGSPTPGAAPTGRPTACATRSSTTAAMRSTRSAATGSATAGASRQPRRRPPASRIPRPSGCASRPTRTGAAGSSPRAMRPARSSMRSTSAASTPCSADACPTTPAWTCASPISPAVLRAAGPGTSR